MADNEASVFWPGFQVPVDFPASATPGSVAEDVLTTFGISFENQGGGSLTNVDIKRADAFATLKASLLEAFAMDETSKLLEVRINSEGVAEFYEVGADYTDIRPYYSIESSTYTRPKVGVSVTGAKPRQERILHDWYQVIGPEATSYTMHDTTKLNTACLSNLVTHVTITYRDPLKNTGRTTWNNGIEDILELTNPFDRFIGFSWRVTPPETLVTPFTKIYQQQQSSVPISLTDPACLIGIEGPHPNIGTLIRRKMIVNASQDLQNCSMFDDDYYTCSNMSVPLNINMVEGLTYDSIRGTRVSKFLGVSGVFVVGIPLRNCFGVPINDSAALQENSEENSVLTVFSTNAYKNIIKLNESIHYATLYPKIGRAHV